MREVIFRGKRKDGFGWAYGYLIIEDNGTSYIHWSVGGQKKAASVISETVGQFTSVIDGNDVKVFEGDVCTLDSIHLGVPHVGRVGSVVFSEGAFLLDFGDDAVLLWSDSYYVNIHGNIHEK